MAILNGKYKVKNSKNSYDVIHLETSANQVIFNDGKTFQEKLDSGVLKGDKGDTGATGLQGLKGDKGDKGDAGRDGLTTSVTVNGTKYTHSNGNITLPNYPNSPLQVGAEPANPNIQEHISTVHAPSDAQKNSDITKAEIEAKLKGTITSHTHSNSTTTSSGFMSKEDKVKLNSIESNANNYIHPSTHNASMIVQDKNNRFVTDTEKANWDSKETTTGSQDKANKALISSKEYTDTKINELTINAPTNLNTFKEVADALGGDNNFSTNINEKINQKANSIDVYTKSEIDKILEKDSNSNASIKDEVVSEDSTWSSKKIKENIDRIDEDLTPIDNDYIVELFKHDGDTTNPIDYYTKEEIDEKLDSTKTTECSTINGISEFNCDNSGYIDNMVIEGKTEKLSDIVTTTKTYTNLYKNITSSAVSTVEFDEYEVVPLAPEEDAFALTVEGCSTSYTGSVTISIGGLVAGETYTLGMELMFVGGFSGNWCGRLKVNSNSNGEVFNEYFNITSSEYRLFTFTPTGSSVALTFILSENELDVYNIRIFKGNHTGKTKASFLALEGTTYSETVESNHRLVSVGQGDKIEVLTINGSKYDLSGATYTTGFFNSTGGLNLQDKHKVIEQYLEVEEGKTYVLENIAQATCYYDINKNLVHYNIDTLICNSPYPQYIQSVHHVYYSVVKIPKGVKYIRVSTGINSVGKINIYKDGNYDHKQIPVTLRSLPNGVKDTIEKRGNKYVKVQRCGEVVLDGNETVTIHTTTNIPVFNISVDLGSSLIDIISDKYKTVSSSGKEEGILYDYSNKRFRISTSKFNDIDAFVTDLKSNPVTIVYELATPQIIELPNFNPQTYEGDNTLLINSGVIQCDASFDVCEGIRSELDVIKDKVSSLDDYVVDEEVYRPTLLNGFSQVHSDDNNFIKKIGNMCFMNLVFKNTSSVQDGTLICKLPLNFKSKNVTRVVSIGSVLNANVDINENNILIYPSSENISNVPFRVNCCWEVE